MKEKQYASNHIARVAVCMVLLVSGAKGQELKLSMREAVELALRQNHALKMAHFALDAERQKQSGARSAYFPKITTESNLLHVSDLERVEVPAGTLGSLPGGGVVPSSNVLLPQGKETLESSGTEIAQPLTQLVKIREANKIAASDVAKSEASLQEASTDVVYRVHELYYRILTTQLLRDSAKAELLADDENLSESSEQFKNGSLLEATLLENRANSLEAKQTLLTAEMQISDSMTQLDDLLGLPLDTKLTLDPNVEIVSDEPSRDDALQTAMKDNPELKEAHSGLTRARAAHAAAKAEYIPDITAFARDSYQNGVSFVDHNFGTFGIHLSYDLFDAGKRQAQVRERKDEVSEAEENVERIREEITTRIAITYNRLETTRSMVDVAKEVLAARQASARLAENQFNQGATLASQRDASRATEMKAKMALLSASLDYCLAQDELARILGDPVK
jgi:outer membrane protein TolC